MLGLQSLEASQGLEDPLPSSIPQLLVGKRLPFPSNAGPYETTHNMASVRGNIYMRKKTRKTEAKVFCNLTSDITFHLFSLFNQL